MTRKYILASVPFLVLSVLLSCVREQEESIMVIPIRESNGEVTLTIDKGGETLYVADIRLAREGEEPDYCVPLDLKHFGASVKDVSFSGIDAAEAWMRGSSQKRNKNPFTTSIDPAENGSPVKHFGYV